MTRLTRPARRLRQTLAALLLVGTALGSVPQALAQGAGAAAPVDPNAVVATVAGQNITEAEIQFALEDMGSDLPPGPPEEQRALVVSLLIDMKLIAQAARESGLGESDLFKQRLAFLEQRSLYRAFFDTNITATVTPEAMQGAYAEFVANVEPQTEVKARHILVPTQEEIDAVVAELAAGKAFEDVAKEKSIDGSAAEGGDLGYFRRGMMVKPFEDAAFALSPGEVSAPVQSQFGFHVIRLDDSRPVPPPAIAQVAPQLQQYLIYKAYNEVVTPRRAAATVTYADPALEAAVEQLAAPESEAGDAAAGAAPAPATP